MRFKRLTQHTMLRIDSVIGKVLVLRRVEDTNQILVLGLGLDEKVLYTSLIRTRTSLIQQHLDAPLVLLLLAIASSSACTFPQCV